METKTETTNTAPAPVVAAEVNPIPAAPPVKKSLPTIARRKVMMGKHRKTGAPRLEVIGLHKNKKRGAFSKQDIFDANGQTISMLTITKRIKDLIKAGELCKMADKAKQTGPGKPKDLFNFDLSKAAPKKNRKKAAAPAVVAEQPAMDLNAQPAEAAPVVAEQPAPAPVAEAAPAVEQAV